MLSDEERQRRKDKLVIEIRERQSELGHEGPTPAFLNLITDKLIDFEYRLEQIEERLNG